MTILFAIYSAEPGDEMVGWTMNPMSLLVVNPAAIIVIDLGVRIATFNLEHFWLLSFYNI